MSLSIKENKKDIENKEIDPRDGTEEGDKILGEAALRIRKECKLISKEEFYKEVNM